MSRKSISKQLSEDFYLSTATAKMCDKHYILHWEGEYIHLQVFLTSGRIIREDISYTPIFNDNITAMELLENPAKIYKLSFRRLSGQIGGIVIIARKKV